ncbi:helicase-related protein [Parvibaculum sp.]|uniref:helicase-related protein n=1 Tax=Parvibaculum sp. TaxID=2024848 RepID=UPI002733C9EE|nr:helicase-related protein [Parvibaculum sp.]MDP3327187.1 helicase-related protein [Parvibaculum sp.]
MKVVGGAGGKLNHLRLTGVKPQSEYKDAIAERAKARREVQKHQRARDRELGLKEAKAEAHARISEQKRDSDRLFVEGVAAAMGWAPEDYRFDSSKVEGQPAHVANKLRQAHELEMVKRAAAAVNLNRERILADAGARAEVDLGEIPFDSDDADELSVQDIDPVRSLPSGLGFSADYRERAERAGATEEAVSSEAEAFKKPLSDGQRRAAIANGETAKLVGESLNVLREKDEAAKLAPKIVEARKALELMKLDKRRKMEERQARDARKKINEATTEPKAYVIDVDDAAVDAKVSEEMTNDMRTIATRAFLSEVAKSSPSPTADLRRAIGVGAYNSVNALALAAGGAALVDRSVVDVLGVAGAAEVLSRRLHTDLSPEEAASVADGMEEFHLHHYMQASEEAIARARELGEQAAEIELGEAENGHDLAVLQEINKRRMAAIGESQKVLGQALGEMEANAALVYAMKRVKSDKPFQVSLGGVAVEDAIRQVRAIGLQRGDYMLDTVAGNRVLTVTPEGLDRLAAPVNRGDLEQVRRNLDIISGAHDEEGWIPLGLSDRPDLDMAAKPGVAAQFAEPFTPGDDLHSSIRDYIGGRVADGDSLADVLADLQSADFVQKAGWERADEYRNALDVIAPLQDENGKMRPAESLRPEFEKMADEFVESRYGASRTPLHRQTFEINDTSVDALHRALAEEPAGVAAYKQIGEMTPQDQGALREYFAKHVARETEEAGALRHELDRHVAGEPEREATDMFGDTVPNPEWGEWRRRQDEMATKVNAGSITWSKYVESMRGPENAYAAMQDVVRSSISKHFVEAYNTLKPDAALSLGRTTVRNNLNHLDAVDPKARDARLAKERAMVDSLRERAGGRYAAGSVRDKLDSARTQQAGFEASQMGFFADQSEPEARALAADERYTVGHEAERRIAEMMPQIGHNFRPGQPVKLFRPTMSGGKNWARQRAIKLIEANKRTILSFGTGGGKTLISLAGFTNLHQKGKASRGLFLVPSIVQGQFNGEALRFLKPGTFKWHAKPGASRDERIAAYKDPTNHFAVMTHQSFRDDMLHLGAGHAGVAPAVMSATVDGMTRAERKEWMRGVMRREGINFDYLTVDEGHNTLNRQGKENSSLANVVDAMSDNSNYYVSASADPVKNDVSEAFSMLQKMDPDRYTDQDAFMRRYGPDTLAAKDGLRRELARFQYPSKIDPDITATKTERRVELNADQKQRLASLDENLSKVRLARMRGDVDIEAMRAISPQSFAGVDAGQVEAVARELQKNVGIMKDTAVRGILNGGAKVDEVAKVAAERRGKPGVVFAHSLKAVESIAARLKEDGYRVVSLTGKDSAKAKAEKRRMFNPDVGEAEADILVSSDAGATGMNVQRGQWLVQVDTPDTAKTHAQRAGRVNRIGQKNDVDLIDLVADHPDETRARERLTTKYGLRDALTTPMESLDDTGLAYFLRKRAVSTEQGSGVNQ